MGLQRGIIIGVAASAMLMLFAGHVRAQANDYPSRPIKLIVPFPPGGGNDNVARPIAAKVGELLGQTLIIENKPGAGTMIGAEAAARSAPDGYTLFLGSIGSHAVSPMLYKNVPYDPVKDFEPVTLLATAPNILVTSPQSKFSTLAQFVTAAKAAPGKYTYASPGVGTPAHLAAEIFKKQAGIDILHVPYKGGANYIPDVIAGRVDVVFDTTTSSLPFVDNGQMRALAISRSERLPEIPDVPTFAQAGYPQYRTGSWYGILVPAKTPRAIVDRLNAAFRKALQDPATAQRLRTLGADPAGDTPQEFAAFINGELAKYGQVIKDNGITAE
ncbi:MAG TPA: tripartite tricarboxylate transporter substrate binding protein [Casimicrobiaceae bacterium]